MMLNPLLQRRLRRPLSFDVGRLRSEIMKWQMWRISRNTAGVPSRERGIETHEAYDKCKAYRAEVIEGATYVEKMLEVVLCDALAGKDAIHRDRLKGVVFAGGIHFLSKVALASDSP